MPHPLLPIVVPICWAIIFVAVAVRLYFWLYVDP